MKVLLSIAPFLYIFSISAQNLIASAELGAENVTSVSVQGSFVDVYVKNGNGVYFKGVIYGSGKEGDFEFDANIEGETLIVNVINNRKNYSWMGSRVKDSRIDLTIPNNVGLLIDNSSGDIYVNGLNTSRAKLKASSGDIEMKNVIANLEVGTSSGDIEITGLTGDSKLKSSSGDQKIVDSKGDITTQASSGDITVIDFDGNLSLRATSGDIEFRNGEGSFKVRTTSGEIDGSNVSVNDKCYFEATSGNVKVDFNDLGELSFSLSATSGDLSVGSKSGEKKLILDRGGFKITGVTTSGDQEYE